MVRWQQTHVQLRPQTADSDPELARETIASFTCWGSSSHSRREGSAERPHRLTVSFHPAQRHGSKPLFLPSASKGEPLFAAIPSTKDLLR
jgi:hypothetical protein